jgi:Lanthionine synthetase C-like protein
MLFDPARHEPLVAEDWNPERARAAIEWIVGDAEANCSPESRWPLHPKDLEPGDDPSQPSPSLYYGAAGVIWALRYLRATGAVTSAARTAFDFALLREGNRAFLMSEGGGDFGSYLFGELPIDMMAWQDDPSDALAARLATLIGQNIDHPARELMWGSPGSLLAATFLHERSGDPRWADLVRRIAARLEEQLLWSEPHGCHYWCQDLFDYRSTYLDGVHGFVATAHGLIRGRHLLGASDWQAWERRIANTVSRTATREDGLVNWRPELIEPSNRPPKMLMQFCHGAPGFVICLASFPGGELDELLLAAGEAIWIAGPLAKGSNLCHGTAGNGYAFLKLFERTGDAKWLQRARAFAMHAIGQTKADAARYGRLRHSLWTGDPGVAVYLWDCLRAKAAFPTLDVFFAPAAAG